MIDPGQISEDEFKSTVETGNNTAEQSDTIKALAADRGIDLLFNVPYQNFLTFQEYFGNSTEEPDAKDVLIFKAEERLSKQLDKETTKSDTGKILSIHYWPKTETHRLILNVTLWAAAEDEEESYAFFLNGKVRGIKMTVGMPREFKSHLGIQTETWEQFSEALNARNRRLGFKSPFDVQKPKLHAYLTQPDYTINTSVEADALMSAISDAPTGRNWETDDQAGTRTHRRSKTSCHYVQLSTTEQEYTDRIAILESYTQKADADAMLAFLYVSRLLAPPSPLPPNLLASGWVDLDDVASKIWPAPRSSKERKENRKKIYEYICFLDRAEIKGQRPTKYIDSDTGKEIPTRIDGPILRIMRKEFPQDANLSLFSLAGEVPLRIEIVASADWSRLASSPELANYLPYGELLGAIPGDQPSGSWARVIGLALANTWRRKPRETLEFSLKMTRRELLEKYDPKKKPPREVLNSSNPNRAIKYWNDALAILTDCGFIAKKGEAALTAEQVEQIKKTLPRYNWQDEWLNTQIELWPGSIILPAVQERSKSLPASKPRQLSSKKSTGRRTKGISN
jgi:hypothetical protein